MIRMDKIDKIISPKWQFNQKNNALVEDHSIVIDGNIIKDILPTNQVHNKYQANEHIVLIDHLIIPGLINSFNDSSLILFQDINKRQNNNIKSYNIFKNQMVNNEHRDISSAVRCIEMIKNGITTFCDHGIFPESMIDQTLRAKLRSNIGLEIQKQRTNWAINENQCLDKALRVFDQYSNNPDIKFFFNPISIDHVSTKMLKKISKISNELDISLRMNVNSSELEIQKCIENHKCRPIEYLEKMDILDNEFTALNVSNLNQKDIEILKMYKSNIVINKSINISIKNMYIKDILDNNINMMLSSGSMINNINLDMLDEVSNFSLLSNIKKYGMDTASLFNLITVNSAQSLGVGENIGLLSKGYLADLVSIDIKDIMKLSSVKFDGIENKLKSSNIKNVWIAGRQIMKNKKILTVAEDKIYTKFRSIKKQVIKHEY